MSESINVLAFAGSARTESFNKRLIRVAASAAETACGSVTLVDFRELSLPLYDGDLEESEGFPDAVKKFRELMLAHDGLLISAPEYNGSITPLLKNAIDWASRPAIGKPSGNCFEGKVAALLSASPGALGGIRGLVHVREILFGLQVLVLPGPVSIRQAYEAFDEGGALRDEKKAKAVAVLTAQLVDWLSQRSPG